MCFYRTRDNPQLSESVLHIVTKIPTIILIIIIEILQSKEVEVYSNRGIDTGSVRLAKAGATNFL